MIFRFNNDIILFFYDCGLRLSKGLRILLSLGIETLLVRQFTLEDPFIRFL